MKRITKFVSNNSRLTLFGAHSSSAKLRQNGMDDYDTNYSIDDQVKLESFRGSIQENLNEFEEDEDVQQIPKPPQAHDEHNQTEEVPIKIEVEEPIEVKPETSHNSKIKFFEAMQSLILCLDTPSLFWIQSKIYQKIQEIEGPDEVMLNDELVLTIDLLIARMTNHSVVNLSNNVESVNLSNFEMAPSTSNRWITDPEYFDLLNYLIERAENVKSPMNIQSLAREFKTTSAAVQSVSCLVHRIEALRTWIQSSEHIDKNTKVKLMFALRASVYLNFLGELRKNAFVEVNDEKQITHYKANDGSLELGGDQSQSAKNRTAQVETKRSYRSLIIDYFENKKNADTSPKTEKQSEMWNLIELITEKCENVNTPLSITRLAKDFIQRFGVSVHLLTIHKRIKVYCREIQTMEFLDTHSKIRQLFGLSATLDSDYIEKLRKVAFVKVDLKNRIIEYISNDGSLTLRGSHWGFGKNNGPGNT
ncbi:hypothetical protein CAEBREN_12207 [Caenorhabditis brenneri]|uniref:SPK domain-containing protein n=1 Tax=Caenorhabditis brenneri TaxID=135651 RepID=G0MFW7_CAEBE|nr:hypothetical protein CAEBREN_12207 [Caenorhabditis brenneri]